MKTRSLRKAQTHSDGFGSGATMQEHFLCRGPVLPSITPLCLSDTSGVSLQRQQNRSHTHSNKSMHPHTHTARHKQFHTYGHVRPRWSGAALLTHLLVQQRKHPNLQRQEATMGMLVSLQYPHSTLWNLLGHYSTYLRANELHTARANPAIFIHR